jgi:hypothetical protein
MTELTMYWRRDDKGGLSLFVYHEGKYISYKQHPLKQAEFAADFSKGFRTMQVLLKRGYKLVKEEEVK